MAKADRKSPIHVWVRDHILDASGPSPRTPWVPIPKAVCKPHAQGMLFSVGGYGLRKRLGFTAVAEQDACGPNVIATVVKKEKTARFGGHNTDACSGHHHFNSLVPGMKLTIPRMCVNDAGR